MGDQAAFISRRRLPPPHRPEHVGEPRRRAAAARARPGSSTPRSSTRRGTRWPTALVRLRRCRRPARRGDRPRRQRGALPARPGRERRRALLGPPAGQWPGRRTATIAMYTAPLDLQACWPRRERPAARDPARRDRVERRAAVHHPSDVPLSEAGIRRPRRRPPTWRRPPSTASTPRRCSARCGRRRRSPPRRRGVPDDGRPAADRDRRRAVRRQDDGGARAGPLAEEFAGWHTDGEPTFPDGTETFDHALERVTAFFADHADEPGTTLIATHGSLGPADRLQPPAGRARRSTAGSGSTTAPWRSSRARRASPAGRLQRADRQLSAQAPAPRRVGAGQVEWIGVIAIAAVGDRPEVGVRLVVVRGVVAVDAVAARGPPRRPPAPAGRGRCACPAGQTGRRIGSAGTLTLRIVPSGMPCASTCSTRPGQEGAGRREVVESLAPEVRAGRGRRALRDGDAGMPSRIPSNAAATVPE